MRKILAISLSLKNAYRVNCILYMLQQTPIIKHFLPDYIFGSLRLKHIANLISVIWEVLSTFVVKIFYMAVMIIGVVNFYESQEKSQLFLHIFIFLTVLGSFTNTYIFKPGKDKYYALVLLKMDAQRFAISNYGYYILKTVIGFAITGGVCGFLMGLTIWQTVLIPFSVVGLKMIVSAISLLYYEKTEKAPNEDKINYLIWAFILILLLGAYGLPLIGIIFPIHLTTSIMVIASLGGIFAIYKIATFKCYHSMYREILMLPDNALKQDKYEQVEQTIEYTTNVSNRYKGLEYLNKLFVKRHSKILWKSAKRITIGCILLTTLFLAIGYLFPNKIPFLFVRWTPSFLFLIMYIVNRGGEFTKALYMNCDYSLLTYSFFRKPEHIIKLFIIRLNEIIKINLLPAFAIGVGLFTLMCVHNVGNMEDYIIGILLSVCLSVFFSTHHLLMYYLLQPYTVGTHVKSGDYRILEIAPSFICLWIIKMNIPAPYLGLLSIALCALYYFAAIFLVKRCASTTFKIRS